jgi:excisionase family DNA binding protein
MICAAPPFKNIFSRPADRISFEFRHFDSIGNAWNEKAGRPMRDDDPKVRELFNHVRQAVNILEEILLRPLPEPGQSRRSEDRPPLRDPPAQTKPQKLAYSIKEVHALVGTSRSKIYREIGDGKLRAVKRGHRTLILATDLQDWIGEWPEVRTKRP